MKLSALAGAPVAPDPDILGLSADSRAIRPGYLFAALPGVNADGAIFIPQAEEKGAAAVLARPAAKTRLPLVADENPRARLAAMAARFYPGQPEIVAGVTGTNGKTSTVHFTAQLWTALGRHGGSLGTLGARARGFDRPSGLTTPDPVALHEIIDAMAAAGVDRLAMEVSSHAIAQSRADGVRFAIAGFTNITQDHLDYHEGFEDYFAAKARLFETLLPADGTVVVNADGEGADRIAGEARRRGRRVLSTGAAGADIALLDAAPSPAGIDLRVRAEGRDYSIALPLIGLFQAENALLAAGIVMASGEAAGDVLARLDTLAGAPGRMQLAASVNGAGIYVDYAHTPDAVATALKALRPHAAGRIIAIVGAGGDRDRKKRPLMGAAAAAHADAVIVTDDNPRTEDPAQIRRAVMEGAGEAVEIGDRREAIAHGVSMLRAGDVLLVAGKGHETGQQVGDRTLPFDDVAAARDAAAASGGQTGMGR